MHYAIIAAGEGSRLREEGIDVPKPLVRIGGVTLLERLIGMFRSQPDCEEVSVIINPASRRHVLYSETDTDAPWAGADNVIFGTTQGSMHSLAAMKPLLSGCTAFCLTTVDTVFRPEEFDLYLERFRNDSGADGYMAVTDYIDDEKPLYISTDEEGIITGFFDAPRPDTAYVSGGVYTLPVSALDILDECVKAGMTRMRDFQRALSASGMRLRAYRFSRIIDIDHAGDIPKAEQLANPTANQPSSLWRTSK